MTVFGAGSGLTGAINSLDDLGIDFNGTTGQLTISDSAKLQQALTGNTSAVAVAFFQTAKTGFGSIVNSAVTDIVGQSASEVQNLQSESKSLGDQITTMQNQLASEQAQLEAEFEAMETMEAQYQNELPVPERHRRQLGGQQQRQLQQRRFHRPPTPTSLVNGASNSSTSSTSSSTSTTP